MLQLKTLQEWENELRPLMLTEAGRAELESLASLYAAASGRTRPQNASVITYIIVHERKKGLIAG